MSEDYFEDYAIEVDADCVSNDFDDYDLYGERTIESEDDFGNDLELN